MFAYKLFKVAKRLIGIVRYSIYISTKDTAHDKLSWWEILIIDLCFYHFLTEYTKIIVWFACNIFKLTHKLFALLFSFDGYIIPQNFKKSDIEAVISSYLTDAVPVISDCPNLIFFSIYIRDRTITFTKFKLSIEILTLCFKTLSCLFQTIIILSKILMIDDLFNVHIFSVCLDKTCSAEVVFGFYIAEYFRETLVEFEMLFWSVSFNSRKNVESGYTAKCRLYFWKITVVQQYIFTFEKVDEEVASWFITVCTVHLRKDLLRSSTYAFSSPIKSLVQNRSARSNYIV